MSAKRKDKKKKEIGKVLRKPEARLSYEQERLLLSVQESLAAAIEESGLSQAEVARRIGHDRSFITNALSGGRNLTLKTIATLAWATSHRVGVTRTPFAATAYGAPLYCVHSAQANGLPVFSHPTAMTETTFSLPATRVATGLPKEMVFFEKAVGNG